MERLIIAQKDNKSKTTLVIKQLGIVGSGVESTVSTNAGVLTNQFGERALPSDLIIKHFKKRMGSLNNTESASQAVTMYELLKEKNATLPVDNRIPIPTTYRIVNDDKGLNAGEILITNYSTEGRQLITLSDIISVKNPLIPFLKNKKKEHVQRLQKYADMKSITARTTQIIENANKLGVVLPGDAFFFVLGLDNKCEVVIGDLGGVAIYNSVNHTSLNPDMDFELAAVGSTQLAKGRPKQLKGANIYHMNRNTLDTILARLTT